MRRKRSFSTIIFSARFLRRQAISPTRLFHLIGKPCRLLLGLGTSQHLPGVDAPMNESQRLALVAIVEYRLILLRKKGDPEATQKDIAIEAGLCKVVDREREVLLKKPLTDKKVRARAATAILHNFLATAAVQGSPELKAHFNRLIQELPDFRSQAPRHIQVAINSVYPELDIEGIGDIRTPSDQAVVSSEFSWHHVVSSIRHKDQKLLEQLGKYYAGVWDVVRYTARQEDGPDPWVVRAALEIGPIDAEKGGEEPWFTIHYRPSGMRSPDFLTTTGTILLINGGLDFQLTGYESVAKAPLYVIVRFDGEKVGNFQGLLLRRHTQGRMFASRVSFVRSKAASMGDLTDAIGVYRESKLRGLFSGDITDLDACLDEAVNTTRNNGKGVLLL